MNVDIGRMQMILDRNKPSEKMRNPFRHNGWLIATDGHAMLAVKSNEGLPATPAQQKIASGALSLIAAKSTGDVLPMSLLRSITKSPGPPQICDKCKCTGSIKCEKCEGGGSVECTCRCPNLHDKDCPDCSGSGSFDCGCGWTRRVRCRSFLIVEGVVFDADLFSDFLWLIDASEFRFTLPEKEKAWVIGGDDWRLAIMPVKANEVDLNQAVTLSLSPKGVAV